VQATAAAAPEITVPSAILIEAETGKVLYEKNADEKMSIASVTKVMTCFWGWRRWRREKSRPPT
jgi:D-alanyl-D-alanine carboxypeptidase (penicillin-binding protein 5/6)